MLTEMQKASLITLSNNDPELLVFLTKVGKFVMAPKIFSYCLAHKITGNILKDLAFNKYRNNPEKFVQEFNKQINSTTFSSGAKKIIT